MPLRSWCNGEQPSIESSASQAAKSWSARLSARRRRALAGRGGDLWADRRRYRGGAEEAWEVGLVYTATPRKWRRTRARPAARGRGDAAGGEGHGG